MDRKLLEKLDKRKKEGTLRSLSFFEGMQDFYSNDYLGLSHFQGEKKTIVQGSTGSRLISGNSQEALNCENFLANFFKAEAALVYNSGYDSNLGLFSSVPQRGDTIIYDENIHASVRDGIRLSLAYSYSFDHNSLENLKKKLENAKGTIYVAVESLYSMDGDIAPLLEIVRLSKQFNANVIVDEAHACGVYGENGRGLVDLNNLQNDVFARVVSFGKAYGFHGASVIGEKDLIHFLINFSRSFIYTTALPKNDYIQIQNNVGNVIIQNSVRQLNENIRLFRRNIKNSSLVSDETSPIQIIRLGNIKDTEKLSGILQKEKFAVKPIYSPTVNIGKEGIRICLHSFNLSMEIEKLCLIINQFLSK